ncbi:hypothetical protein LT493_00280 [Streptomyces tricolor]|nr:hypothetical protein [Streptomyces tricolor]
MDVLHRAESPEVLLVAVGVMASVCLQAAELLDARGIGCTVVDPRWVKPVDPALPGLAARHRLVAVVEDNQPCRGRGFGGGAGPRRRRRGRAGTAVRHPRAVPRARQAQRGAGRHRPHARRDRRADQREPGRPGGGQRSQGE